MKRLALSILLFAIASAFACECLPPGFRAKNAKEAIQHAKFVVHAHVIDSGWRTVKLQVLESFKGPNQGSIVEVPTHDGQCGNVRLKSGDDVFITSFGDSIGFCDIDQPDQALLTAFRRAASKPQTNAVKTKP